MANDKKPTHNISLETDLELNDKKEEPSVYQQIGQAIANIAEGGSAAELRKVVQSNMPKTLPEATAYVKRMERIRYAGEVVFQSAQELMGSISG